MENEQWGRRIRAFRKLKGYTQESFAHTLGISISVLGEVERGTRVPTEDLIEKIVTALQISKEELTSNK
ncbi:transcriptional regulator [Alkalihalophilus pseudofirmus]|uniref:helix-turn-helix domain-containing protein n=1 Tax=Alkalihalobacterium alkalinitrilicum TaxID=427920 RepID=UPI00094DB104|nr:helix-turn-helix transcriptional regulator [Alkalihalobacterium alkalinitrilicum]OLO27401.1 transcriptional regulator [Alkalihalophilus pseudofirmus]